MCYVGFAMDDPLKKFRFHAEPGSAEREIPSDTVHGFWDLRLHQQEPQLRVG